MWLIDGWWKDRAPSGTNGLTFGHCTVEDDGLLSWRNRRCERSFLRKVFDFWEGDLECKDSALNENASLWWRFSATRDRTVDQHHKREWQ